jgi:hypothetical protein
MRLFISLSKSNEQPKSAGHFEDAHGETRRVERRQSKSIISIQAENYGNDNEAD